MPTEQYEEMMDALWAEVIAGSDGCYEQYPTDSEIKAMYDYMVNREL